MCEGEEEVQKTLTTLEKGKYIILSKVQLTQVTMRLLQSIMKDEWREPIQTLDESQEYDASQNEHNMGEREERQSTNESQDLTLSQSRRMEQNQTQRQDTWAENEDENIRNPEQNDNNTDQMDPRPGTSRSNGNGERNQQDQNNKKEPKKWDKNTPICRFYKMNTCKFGNKCREPHPKFCRKYMSHGSQKFNANGCDSKCGKPHPSTCRNAMKNNECVIPDCRYFHARGTKRGEQDQNEIRHKQNQATTNNKPTGPVEQKNYWEQKTKEQDFQSAQNRVFYETQTAMMTMIERLNVQMTNIQKSLATNRTGWQTPQNNNIQNQPQTTQHQNMSWPQNQNTYQSQIQHQNWQQPIS